MSRAASMPYKAVNFREFTQKPYPHLTLRPAGFNDQTPQSHLTRLALVSTPLTIDASDPTPFANSGISHSRGRWDDISVTLSPAHKRRLLHFGCFPFYLLCHSSKPESYGLLQIRNLQVMNAGSGLNTFWLPLSTLIINKPLRSGLPDLIPAKRLQS